MSLATMDPVAEAESIINSSNNYSMKITNQNSKVIPVEELSACDQERVTARGYAIRREVGEGQGSTRRAFYATQNTGNLEREVVLKIPRKEEQIKSVTAQINLSKKNRDLQEALISGKLRHSHIVRVTDSFQLQDGRTVNAEDFIDGWSVRALIKKTNPITDSAKLRKTFAPLIDALRYTHGCGVLHRDITPANILIPEHGEGAVLTDWQNAAYLRDIESVAIPTRGGTNCTHPILLNGLMKGTPSRATERTDVYSLGTVLYEAITGDAAFDYSLVSKDNGKKITINGKELSVGLKSKGKDLDSITVEDHEARLKEAVKKVPRNLRKLLYGMMTTKEGKEIYSMKKVEEEFLEATKPGKTEKLERFVKYAKAAGLGAAIGFGGMFAGYLGLIIESQPKTTQPTLADVLRTQSSIQAYSIGNWENGSAIRNGGVRTEFDNYQKQIEKNMDKLTGDFYKQQTSVSRNAGVAVDTRLTFALMRSIKLEDHGKLNFTDMRHPDSLVPLDYVRRNLSDLNENDADPNSEYMKSDFIPWMWMGRYVQSRYSMGDSLEEVFAKSLCSNEEIELARANTQQSYLVKRLREKGYTGPSGTMVGMGEITDPSNIKSFNYFPRTEKEQGRGLIKGNVEIAVPGYAEKLDPIKKRIIDRAVLLYLMSDSEGNIKTNSYSAEALRL